MNKKQEDQLKRRKLSLKITSGYNMGSGSLLSFKQALKVLW